MAREEKIKCTCCCEDKRPRDFYKSASELNKATGKMSICKDCMQNRYNELLSDYDGNSIDAFRHLCLNLDIFYDEQLYNSCVMKDGVNFIGEYMRLSATKERRDKTSRNNTIDSSKSRDVVLDDGNIISDDIIVKWGRGRKKEDYILLEKRYNEKIKDYPSKKPAERAIIRSICLLELDIEEARISDRKSIPQLEKTMADKFKQLGINPSDDNIYDEQSMLIFGVIMSIIENDRPIVDKRNEYSEDPDFHWYWYRNVIVPTLKAWDMANGDYSLENGIDNIEVQPEIKALMEDYHGE